MQDGKIKEKPTPECPENCRYNIYGICIHETYKDGICHTKKISCQAKSMNKRERLINHIVFLHLV